MLRLGKCDTLQEASQWCSAKLLFTMANCGILDLSNIRCSFSYMIGKHFDDQRPTPTGLSRTGYAAWCPPLTWMVAHNIFDYKYNYAIKNNTNKPTLHPAAHTATLHTIPWFQLSLLGVSATSNFSNLPRRAKWATMGGKRSLRSLNFFEAVAVSSRTKLEGYCVQSLSICAKCVLIKNLKVSQPVQISILKASVTRTHTVQAAPFLPCSSAQSASACSVPWM